VESIFVSQVLHLLLAAAFLTCSVSPLIIKSDTFSIDDEDSLLHLQGASISYRIAMGPQQGQKVFTLQTLPVSTKGEYGQLANISGSSLHAGVFANADEPDKLERLCRYISRPGISEQRWKISGIDPSA
jgi:hypothetical protein